MPGTNGKQFLFNYGWDHFWHDPKYVENLEIREFIKGSFARPKLVYSVPFVTRCQQDGTSVECSEGVPDCWAEYLTQKLRFFRKYLRNYELMHKENVDIVPLLRKYRLYIGQGIPDPWTAYSYNSEICSHLRDTEHQKLPNSKKEERCLCCEREYLFECPDKCIPDANQCPCKDCHGKTPSTSTVKCKCSEIFHNWMFQHNRRKHRRGSSGDGISSPNESHSESEAKHGHSKHGNKFVEFCECIRNRKGCYCSTSDNSDLGGGDHEKPFKCGNKVLKHQAKVYFCPYMKNFYRRKSFENDNSFRKVKKSVSKEIQTESQTIKSSKIVQTEKPERKPRSKCTCLNKCFPCSIICSRSWVKNGCPAGHSIPSFCCSSGLTQRPTFVCPYAFTNHIQKHCENESGEVKKKLRKKKQHKESEHEEGSNTEIDQHERREDGDNPIMKSKIKYELRNHAQTEAQNNLKCNKNIYKSHAPSTTFDHLKYLADYKLKGFLHQEEVSSGLSNNKLLHQNSSIASKFTNFCRGNSSINNLRHEGTTPERYRPVYYIPRYSESSFPESKMNPRQSNISNIMRFNYCHQATMTPQENVEGDVLVNESYSKETIDREKSKGSGFVRSHDVAKPTFGKRRKLLRNRKRRRKLVASILGNQDSLTQPANDKQDIQIEEIPQECLHSKKILSQNFTSSSGHVNYCGNGGAVLNSGFSCGRHRQEIFKKQFG